MKTIFSIREFNTFNLSGHPTHLKNHEYDTEAEATAAAQKLRAQLKEEFSAAPLPIKKPITKAKGINISVSIIGGFYWWSFSV